MNNTVLAPCQMYAYSCRPEDHRIFTAIVAALAIIALFKLAESFFGHH